MNEIAEFLKAAVRPYLICSSWTVILIMWLNQIPIPELLTGVAVAIIGEYGLERAVKRWKEVVTPGGTAAK